MDSQTLEGMDRLHFEVDCESCAVNGERVPAVGHSINPDWSGYNLCASCIAEYDSRPPVNTDDHRYSALLRAARAGHKLSIASERRTVSTLQGRLETGYTVWGMAYGGDDLGCVFPTKRAAREMIMAVIANM